MPCLSFRALPSALICSLALLLLCAVSSFADTIPWDANAQGRFVTCFCRDLTGHVWVGTEDGQGLWSYDPAAKQWTHFPASADLSGDIYALACDKSGRVWAGGMAGVSVYNGRQWRQYGPTDGPLGTRLFALAVSPKDGGVWGATEAGLFRYRNGHWAYFTRAEGLPSDQAQALAFAPDGTLYVGTQCDGIAQASPDDGYKTWRVTPGPRQMPNAAAGSGLPSGLINALLVARDGTVNAGTDCGLARSVDSGDLWHYTRGADWKDKLAGLYRPVAPDPRPAPGDLLREDYVTCLGEDASGRLWVGHRQGGVEAFDPKSGKRTQSGANAATPDDYVSALRLEGNTAWLGLYGGGLLPPSTSGGPSPASPLAASAPPLPTPAAPPTPAELNAMLARVKSVKGEMPIGGGAYLGEDWRTLGDWVGRYGRQYAVLCAVASPMDQVMTWDSHYTVEGLIGPHRTPNDALRHWLQPEMVNTTRLGTLYSPVDGFRTQAEWDDHGEGYSRAFEGPDVWVAVTVPAGVHRVSLYDTNKDAHGWEGNRDRDYLVDLLPYRAKVEDAMSLPPLAHARIHDFWNGTYKSFVVRGPARYYLRVARNGSTNTIVAGIFIDKLAGPVSHFDHLPMPFMSVIHFDPPIAKSTPSDTAPVKAAQAVWAALNDATAPSSNYPVSTPFRVLALRVALNAGGSDDLTKNWQWHLGLWTNDDREWFDRNMELVATIKAKYPNTILR